MRQSPLISTIIAILINTLPLQSIASNNYAAELNDAQAALSAGDYKRAFKEYRHHAKQSNPLAMFSLALFYQNGWGRPVNPRAACEWFEKATQKDIIAAQHFLADCLLAGTHRKTDPSAAISWYLKAGEAGHLISFCSLGNLYMQGQGVEKNPAKGLAYCQQAADSGITSAQLQMGHFLLEGETTIKDVTKATVWFEKAAQNKSLEAYYYLGIIHRDHYNENNNARHWFEQAASHGYLAAYYPTAELYFNAPPAQTTGKPEAINLAKSYLWLSAGKQRINNAKQLTAINTMLNQTLNLMPATWIPDLDKKVTEHLSEYKSPQPDPTKTGE